MNNIQSKKDVKSNNILLILPKYEKYMEYIIDNELFYSFNFL